MEAVPHGSERSGRTSAPSSVPNVLSVGRYDVSRLLGEGSMGRVYLAHDPVLGRAVAIKVLRLDAAGSAREAYIARFRNEARAAATFMHPNVVAVYDAGVDPVLGPYLVYEYVNGHTLRGRIAQGRVAPSELVPLARGVASALDALHSAGILHRDVKPDNLLIAPGGAVKLTDFGIARVPDAQLTRDGQFLGTPAYAPPEAITRGEYSVRGDVYSLAAVLYESLCGERPFPGEDAVTVSYAVANDPIVPPSRHLPGLSAAVDAVFVRALAKKVSDRFGSAGEFAGALGRAFSSASPEATAVLSSAMSTNAPGLARRPQHPPPPSADPAFPVLWKRAAAIGAAMLVVVLVASLFRHDEPAAPGVEAPAATAPAQVPGVRGNAPSPANGTASASTGTPANTPPTVRAARSAAVIRRTPR